MQLWKTIGYYRTRQEGLDALTMYRSKPVSLGIKITLGELYKEWSEAKYKGDISKKTINDYKAAWKDIKVYEKEIFTHLRTAHWQKIINECKDKGLSRSKQHKIKLLVGMLYDYAIDNKITDTNIGKKLTIKKEDRKEREYFSEPDVKAIEKAAAEGIEWADTILILIYTGLRITEFLLLTKFSINLKEQIITGGIKTEAGKNREIPIHPKILPYILKWYNKNGERLICNEKGKAISDRKYREDFYRPALEKIGVRVLNPHSCRHTFATRLSNAGVDTKAIQELIGHANYSTTANIYTHKDVDPLRKAISKL